MMTQRLDLRLLKKSDYKAWKRAYQTQAPQKNRWDSKNKPLKDLTISKFAEFLRQCKKNIKADRSIVFGIFLGTELIGSTSLMNLSRGVTHSCFLGYHLFNNYWGKGFAEEAVRGTLLMAFMELQMHRVVAGIEKENIKSIKLVKKIAFRREGTSKRVVFLRGEWQDLIQYAITCEELGIIWQNT